MKYDRYSRESWAIARRILTELGRRRRSLLFWAVFPVLVLILNGLILDERAPIDRGAAFALAAPATLVGAALFFSCLGGSVATVVAEREQQTLKRLFLSPLSGLSYILGIFMAHSAIAIAQTGLVLAIAWGFQAPLVGHWGLSSVIILLSVIIYVGVGCLLGTQVARRIEDVNALVAAFGVPLLILGGAFLPTSLFPDSLLTLAQWNPIYHMNEALTGVMANGDRLADVQDHVLILSGWAIAVTGLGGWSYHSMVRQERLL